jgi:hypothetical protein
MTLMTTRMTTAVTATKRTTMATAVVMRADPARRAVVPVASQEQHSQMRWTSRRLGLLLLLVEAPWGLKHCCLPQVRTWMRSMLLLLLLLLLLLIARVTKKRDR